MLPAEALQLEEPRVKPHAERSAKRRVEQMPALALGRRVGRGVGRERAATRNGGVGRCVHGREEVGAQPNEEFEAIWLLCEALNDTLRRGHERLAKHGVRPQRRHTAATAIVVSSDERLAPASNRGGINVLARKD